MNQEAFLSSQAALYARVSSKEQEREGYSIPAQRKLLRSYAQRQDYQVVREFVDVETAKQSGRTQFSRMARFLQEHPQVRILLCEKTDRLYRNFKDYVTIDELEVTLVFVKEGSVLNRQSRSHVFPAYAPLGYRHERGRKRIMLDLKRAPLIREMFERYAAGSTSMRALEAHLALAGLVTRKGQAGELQHGGRQAVCGQAPAAHRQGSVRAGAGGHPYPQSHATDGARFCLHGPVEVRRVRRRLPAGGGAGGQFAGILRQLQFSETVFDWTREALRLSQQEKAAFHRRAIEGLNAQYLKLQNRIRQRIQHHQKADENDIEQGIRLLEIARNAHALFQDKSQPERASLIRFILVGSELKDKTVAPVFRPPFDIIWRLAQEAREHQEDIQKQAAEPSAACIILLRRRYNIPPGGQAFRP